MKILIPLMILLLVGCGALNDDDLPPELEPGSGNRSSIDDTSKGKQLETPPVDGIKIPEEKPCTVNCESKESKSEIENNKIPSALMAEINKKLKASRYMSKNCSDASYEGYENLPVQLCSYTMRDGVRGEVYMLNPDALQLASWIKDSCEFIKKDVTSCGLKLFKSVLNASGAQFPIAGMVYEDLNRNGKSEAFAFRHGVTVKISSFGTGTERKLTNSQLRDSLWAEPTSTYRYARIVSTTREQYYTYMNRIGVEAIDVGTSSAGKRKNSWMTVIKYLYTSSWERKANPLMRAWALSNSSRL